MTQKIEIDFYRIHTWKAFYKTLQTKIELPDYFGDNLDALWDWLTGDATLPLQIHFSNFSSFQQKKFEPLLQLFEDAHVELGNDFLFSLEQREDNDSIG